jgi:hypothetical protein
MTEREGVCMTHGALLRSAGSQPRKSAKKSVRYVYMFLTTEFKSLSPISIYDPRAFGNPLSQTCS